MVNEQERQELLQQIQEQKREFLKGLGTKDLFQKIVEAEANYEEALYEEASLHNLQLDYLATYGSDCREVERILAELSLAPPMGSDGKKLTVDEKKAWLTTQRTKDPLIGAINRQDSVTFQVESMKIKVDMTRRRLESLRAYLALRTAQIEFLAN